MSIESVVEKPQTHTDTAEQAARRRADRFKKWLGHLPAYTILGLWSAFTGFIILWVILTSLKSNRQLFTDVWALPDKLHWENYVKALFAVEMERFFLNSLVVVLGSVFLILALSAPAAYILSRKQFKGSNLITMMYIAGIGIPLPLLFIPLFVILTTIGQNNKLTGLGILFVALSLPFSVYMLTGFFGSLPNELEEAAIVDGASDFQVFFKVMLPLATPGMITAAIFNFIFLWNEYQLALIFMNDPKLSTLSLGLYTLSNGMEYTGDWVGLMAGVVIVMVPTILLYIFLSEKMIAGITMGAVKG